MKISESTAELAAMSLTDARLHRMGECRIIVTTEDHEVRGIVRPLLHLSISHPKRYPTWDEIKAAREKYLPRDLSFVMVFPPTDEYVNVHPNCFHLWEEA